MAVNRRTGKYAPRTRSGNVIYALGVDAPRGGTMQQAIACAWKIVRGIKADKRRDEEWVST